MARLGKRLVEGAKPAGRDFYVWDDTLPGFGVRVHPSGRRSYVAKYRAGGRRREYALGVHGKVTPEQARREATQILAAVARGADPAAERRAAARAESVAELAERYLDQHAKPRKKPKSLVNDRLLLARHILPRLGRLPLRAVTRADVTAVHHSLREKPTTANRALALLSTMFNLAERWGLRPDGSNPCRHVERYREVKRERYLSEAELARLGAALAAAEQTGAEEPAVVAAIRLLVFTGCRSGEILGLRWDWVDLERRCIRLPDSKTGPKTVTLNAPALEVLAGLERRSVWVLPGRDPARPLAKLERPWSRICKSAELDGVRVHDLRHSFASIAAGSGVSLLVIGGLLGHLNAATTRRYAHLSDDPLRAASEAVGERIAAALAAKPPAPVAPLPTGTK